LLLSAGADVVSSVAVDEANLSYNFQQYLYVHPAGPIIASKLSIGAAFFFDTYV
jgi:hypothetical protein